MKTWKMVNSEFAACVERGCLRIGTLSSYKSLEDARADDLDGGVEYRSGDRPMMKGDPASEHAMRRLNIDAQLALNVTHQIIPPPAYAFCMSEPGCMFNPPPGGPKIIYEISDAVELAKAITRKFSRKFERVMLGPVQYATRRFDAFGNKEGSANVWIKDLKFKDEQEIRIVWPASGAAEPFMTEDDPELANFFSRVATLS